MRCQTTLLMPWNLLGQMENGKGHEGIDLMDWNQTGRRTRTEYLNKVITINSKILIAFNSLPVLGYSSVCLTVQVER